MGTPMRNIRHAGKDEGGRMKDEVRPKHVEFARLCFIHPSSFIL